jgi:capsule polysaccharide export protein KpsE/RkpR
MTADKALLSHESLVDNVELEPDSVGPSERGVAHEEAVARLRLLWGRRRFLARTSGLGLLLFAIIAFLIPSLYTSTTRLMPPDQNTGTGMGMLAALASGATSGGLGIGGIASDILGLKGSGALFVGILQSRTVEDDVIRKFDLRRAYRDQRWEDARSDLQTHTDIEEDRQNGIISVSVSDKSPERAGAMASEYVEELNLVVTQLNTSSAHREREFLEERLKEVKQDLESAEKDFSEFASKNTAIDISEQGKAMIDAAATLEGQLIAAQTELESLRQIYTNTNVRVRTTQARVDELRRQLQKLGGKPDVASATDNSADQSMYPSIRELPLLGVNYADLYRRTKIQEAIFETLTREYELAKVEEAKETPSVKILDPANVPEKKSYPRRAWIILSGTLFCLAAGIVWILVGSRWENIDPRDPGKAFAQEVFETIRLGISPSSSNGSAAHLSGGSKALGSVGSEGKPGNDSGSSPKEQS